MSLIAVVVLMYGVMFVMWIGGLPAGTSPDFLRWPFDAIQTWISLVMTIATGIGGFLSGVGKVFRVGHGRRL
jgi:hypothetical protein